MTRGASPKSVVKFEVPEAKMKEQSRASDRMDFKYQMDPWAASASTAPRRKTGVFSETMQVAHIRRMDTRNVKKFEEWSGDAEEYTLWHVLFVAYLANFDKQWKGISLL